MVLLCTSWYLGYFDPNSWNRSSTLATRWRYFSQLFLNFFQLFFSTFFNFFRLFFQKKYLYFSNFFSTFSQFLFQLHFLIYFNFLSTLFNFFTEGLALVPILATRWRYFNWLPMWPPDDTTCISCRFGQQFALLESIASLATKWCH